MDLLAQILGGGISAEMPGPASDFWYTPLEAGGRSASGAWVDPASAQKLSAWYRGRMILATVLAMLPFPVYRRLPNDGGSEVASDHPLYDLLHDAPNPGEDSFQWRREKVFNIIDYGWSFDWIVPGQRGYVHELHPLHPRYVTPERIQRGPGRGRYLFHVRDPQTGQTTVYNQEAIFYLRGAEGKGILEFARTNIGTALATEGYAAGIFSSGTLNGGIIKTPGLLNDEAARRMARSFVTKPGEHHLPKVLEQGSDFIPNGMTPEDAQMLLSRKFSVDDVARWLGIPRQMLENSDPSFGNAEQFDESFITYSLGGWLSLFEFAVNSQLITNPQAYYAEFTRDAIARGKLIDRWNVHVAAVNAGIKSVDEARAKEGLNKRGGKADELREPQNITGKPAAAIMPSAPARGVPEKAEAIVTESAARLLRKEVTRVQALAVKHAADQDAFAEAVTDFYASHVALVIQTLQMDPARAERYCAIQAAQLVTGGDWVATLATWRTDDYAAGLATLALDAAA
jgi:HK97 family phage portal protein